MPAPSLTQGQSLSWNRRMEGHCALSLESDRNTWEEINLPDGMTAVPVAAADVLAFSIKRKSIDHVAAFSATPANLPRSI